MAKLRTFIDSGVLLAAFKAGGELAENALAVLGDPERQFVSSDFVFRVTGIQVTTIRPLA